MKGKVIRITCTDSLFKEYLGRYGVVKEHAYDNKWKVEFSSCTNGKGSLTHTVCEEDFEVVGEIYNQQV